MSETYHYNENKETCDLKGTGGYQQPGAEGSKGIRRGFPAGCKATVFNGSKSTHQKWP